MRARPKGAEGVQVHGRLHRQIATKTGHLSPKVHELITLAVAVTTRCDGCISVHTKKAVEHGATAGEITEALGVAIALNAGASLTYSARVLEAHAQLQAI